MDSHDNPCTNLDSLTTWHLRCVNCGVNVTKLQRHLLEIAEVRNLIQQWVRPQQVQVASDSLVCHSCWTSAWNQIRHPTSEQQNAPIVGHRHVCISCGRSLLRIRSHLLRSDSPREERIRNVIAHLIAPRKLPSSSHVCHRCWRRTDLKAWRSTAEIEPLKSASSSSLPSQLPQPSTSSTPRERKEKIQAEPGEELPNDMENDVQDRVMGTVSQERMKKGCVSTKFECQSDTTTHTLTKPSRVAKKRRKLLNEEREEELEEKNVPNTHSEVGEPSTLSSDETTDSATSSEVNQRIQEEVPEEERDDPVVASKCYKIIANVYSYLQKEYESLKSQLEAICDISVMSNILERTAAATGVTQQEVETALLETTLHKEQTRKEDDSESVRSSEGKPTSKTEEHLPFPVPIQLGVQEVMQTECKIEPVDDEYPPKMEDNPLERESPGHCSTAEESDMEMKTEADNDDLDGDQLTFEWWNNKTLEKPSDPLEVSHIGVKIEHMDHDYAGIWSDYSIRDQTLPDMKPSH